MTDQVMSDLERRIRFAAVKQAQDQLEKSFIMAVQAQKIRHSGAYVSTSMPTYKMAEAARELVKEHAELIGNHAVAEFHAAYSKLIVEYPDLVAQAQEDAVEEHINNG